MSSATFTYLRSSAQGISPLISTLSIDSVSIGLNGTVLRCSGVGNPTESASTTIQIINISQSELAISIHCKLPAYNMFNVIVTSTIVDIQYKPTFSISEEHYGADNVTVIVKWTQAEQVQQVYVLYSSTVVPSDVSVITTGITSRQLTIPYNMEYNLSIVATTPCRPNATAVIKLNYGEV